MYRLPIAAHVVVHPISGRTFSTLAPAQLHALLVGQVVSPAGTVDLFGRQVCVSVHPPDARLIAQRTQVSTSLVEAVLSPPLPVAPARHDSSVEAALLGLLCASSPIAAPQTTTPAHVLLVCCKGTGVKTLLRSVLPPGRPLLVLEPGRLPQSTTAAALRRWLAQTLLPLYSSSGAVVYVDDVDALHNDEGCAAVLAAFLSSRGAAAAAVVGRVTRFDALPAAARKAWAHVLEVPLPSLQARIDLVCAGAGAGAGAGCELSDDEQMALAGQLAGVGLAEAAARLATLQLRRTVSSSSSLPAPTAQGGDVSAHSDVLEQLEEMLSLPRRLPAGLSALPASLRLSATGALLHGPPGTGKTLLVRRLWQRRRQQCRLLTLRLVDVVRGEVGAGERAIAAAFQEAKRVAPAILFIDEFQALFVSRGGGGGGGASSRIDDRSLSSALSGCFDDLAAWNAHAGGHSLVTVVAATNEPWAIDVGFLRPGRFDRVLFVGPLSAADRAVSLAQILAKGCDGDSTEGAAPAPPGALDALVAKTDGFSGADVELLALRARDLAADAGGGDLLEALSAAVSLVAPTSSRADVAAYESWHAACPAAW